MDNGNEIVFHDETPQTSMPKGGKNKLGIISLILAVISLILGFSDSTILGLLYFVCLITAFVLSIVALSQIKKKNQDGKIFAILGLVGCILVFAISIVLSVLQFGNMSDQEKNDLFYCPYVSDCVDDNGTSSCKYIDGRDVTCTTENLKQDQFK